MNKLLLLALFSACLIVITNGLEQVEEQSVAELDAEVAALREAREADPKKSKKGRKSNKKARKGKKGKGKARKGKGKARKGKKKARKGKGKARKGKGKARKGKKGRKGKKKARKGKKKARNVNKKTRKGKKKGRKGKGKARKGKKKGRKGKKKGKKGKKKGRKGKKKGRKGKKKGRKGKKKGRKGKKTRKGSRKVSSRASSCMNETCINNAMTYLKIMKDRVANFLSQKSRIEKYNDTSGKKSAKKGLFGPILNRIREAGGGNSSNLKCNGDNSSAGAKQFLNLTVSLMKCEGNINKSCNGDLPKINATEHALCNTAMTAFANLTAGCIKKSGTAACTCWEGADLAFTVKAVKKCDIKEDNKKMTAAKKKCTTAFGKCRKLEDDVSSALSACSPLNTQSRATADIKQGLKNKAAATALSAKINATATATSRAALTLACSVFMAKVSKATQSILQAPLLSGLEKELTALVEATVGTCSAAEKTKLLTASVELDRTASAIDLNIASKQDDLLISTGTTVSTTVLQTAIDAEATTAAPATTASTSRRNRKMFRASNMKMW